MTTQPWLKIYDKIGIETPAFDDRPLGACVESFAVTAPSSPALQFFDRTISYGELNSLTNKLANGLTRLGIGRGDVVGLHMPNIPQYIKRAKDKDDPFRLMGFGHRVYKNMDPRAGVLKKAAHDVLEDLGVKDDPLLEMAMELERIALEDPYFVERKLFPNVDFYSGIILKAMGFPTSMFTVLFAVARTVGWISQWKEMIEEPALRIGRPRQLYTGPAARPYVEVEDRE